MHVPCKYPPKNTTTPTLLMGCLDEVLVHLLFSPLASASRSWPSQRPRHAARRPGRSIEDSGRPAGSRSSEKQTLGGLPSHQVPATSESYLYQHPTLQVSDIVAEMETFKFLKWRVVTRFRVTWCWSHEAAHLSSPAAFDTLGMGLTQTGTSLGSHVTTSQQRPSVRREVEKITGDGGPVDRPLSSTGSREESHTQTPQIHVEPENH